jgi:hypothetical protein
MSTRIHFSPLYVEVLPDGRHNRLTAPLIIEGPHYKFIVPAGFETDYASVPRPLWSIFPPSGKYSRAAVLHDYLYRFSKLSRKRCDDIFLECMDALGVPYFKRYAMYWGVRMGGWAAWNSYR